MFILYLKGFKKATFHEGFLYNSYTVFFISIPILHLVSLLGSLKQLAQPCRNSLISACLTASDTGPTAQSHPRPMRNNTRPSRVFANSCVTFNHLATNIFLKYFPSMKNVKTGILSIPFHLISLTMEIKNNTLY